MKNIQPTKATTFLALSVLLLTASTQAAWCAGEGSLDSMWMEQGDKDGDKDKDKDEAKDPAPAAAPAGSGTAAPIESAVEDTAAPMCTLDNFRGSAIVSKGGWPGVGPFQPDNNNDYFDEHHNKLHIDLSGQQITHAQLDLNNRQLSGNAEKDLLDMQMHIDFFLEAVGIKAGRIQDLNADLAKNKELLLRADDAALNLKAGRCAVTIEKKKSVDGNKLDYVVAVSSLDANRDILRAHGGTARATTPVKPVDPTPTSTPTPIVIAPPSKPPAKPVAAPAASDASLKQQFAGLIAGWQKVKKVAVRNKQTDELATVLAGKALIRQTDAVKWLTTNKKYYDMSPKGVTVDQFAELAPAKKYMVSAQVHEAYKFIDEPTGKVLKEVDDINKVNYTIEKLGGKWFITDSALLAAPQKAEGRTAQRPR